MPVYINNRPIITKSSGGFAKAQSVNFTGENKTPVSYELRAEAADLQNLRSGIKINGEPIATIKSYVAKCSGDEAGDGGGIISTTIGGRCDFLTASPDMRIDDHSPTLNGEAIVRAGDKIILNNHNSEVTTWHDPDFKIKGDDLEVLSIPETKAQGHHIEIKLDNLESAISNCYIGLGYDKLVFQLIYCAQSEPALYFNNLRENNIYDIFLYLPTQRGPHKLLLGRHKPGVSLEFIALDLKQQACELLAIEDKLRGGAYQALMNVGLSTLEKHFSTEVPEFFKKYATEDVPQQNGGDFFNIPQALRAELCPSLRPGFIYVFRANKLWRSLAVRDNCLYERVAQESCGLAQNVLYLPKGDDIKLMFSEVLLSEARLKFYENNPDSKRFYQLDDTTKQVELDDDLGLISRAVNDIEKLGLVLSELMQVLSKEPYYLSAASSWEYFFGSDHEVFKKARGYLDKSKLKLALKHAMRQNIVELIARLQGIIAAKLGGSCEYLADYFACTYYEQGFTKLATILSALGLKDIDPLIKFKKNYDILLKGILKPTNAIYPYLFVSESPKQAGDGKFDATRLANSWQLVENHEAEDFFRGFMGTLHTAFATIAHKLFVDESCESKVWEFIKSTQDRIFEFVTVEKNASANVIGLDIPQEKTGLSASVIEVTTTENGELALEVKPQAPLAEVAAAAKNYQPKASAPLKFRSKMYVLRGFENSRRLTGMLNSASITLRENAGYLAKGSATLVLILSFFNLRHLAEEIKSNQAIDKFEATKKIAILVYATDTLMLSLYNIEKNIAFYSRTEGLKKGFEVLEEKIFLPTPLGLAGAIAATICIGQDVYNIYEDLKHHDVGAAFGDVLLLAMDSVWLLNALGGYVANGVAKKTFALAASTGMSYAAAETAILGQLTSMFFRRLLFCFASFTVGLLAMTGTVVFTVLKHYLQDKPLTAWAKHSPFSIYGFKTKQADLELVRSLNAILFHPQAVVNIIRRDDATYITVSIRLANFKPREDKLEIKTTVIIKSLPNLYQVTAAMYFPSIMYFPSKHIVLSPGSKTLQFSPAGRLTVITYNYRYQKHIGRADYLRVVSNYSVSNCKGAFSVVGAG